MNYTITLTDDEDAFLKSILATKFKTNGKTPTVKSKWDSLTDEEKTQIKSIVDKPMTKEV